MQLPLLDLPRILECIICVVLLVRQALQLSSKAFLGILLVIFFKRESTCS